MSNKHQPLGLDISSYQGTNIDYEKMKDTSRFVIMRSGLSWGAEDATFAANWQELEGHNRGAYHVVYPSQDPIRQAEWAVDIVARRGVDWSKDRLALDVELHQNQSRERISWVVEQMMAHIKVLTGREPILYSAKWFVDQYMVITPKLKNAAWWIATYLARRDPDPTPEHPGPPLMPRGLESWLIHQTSERGVAKDYGCTNGIEHIDLNRWNGTIEELNAYFGRGDVPEPVEPPVEMPEPIFAVKVRAKAGLRVRGGPGVEFDEIGANPFNAVLNVYDVRRGWYRVHPDKNWWCYSRYLRKLARKNRKPSDLREII